MTVLEQYGNCTGPFGFPMKEEEARNLDKTLENNPDFEYFKCSKAGFEYFVAGENADVSILTDSSIDKEGDSVDMHSINWNEFRKNPSVTFNHNYSIPPIGRSLWQKFVNNVWKAKTQYIPRPEGYPKNKEWFPDTLFHMIKNNYLPGKSLGGIAKRRKPTEEDIQKNPELSKARFIRYDSVIYEYSIAPIAVNNNAVVEAISKGIIFLPEEVLCDFNEIYEAVKDIKKQQQEEHPIIKTYTTLEEYNDRVRKQVEEVCLDVQKRTPEILDTVLNRCLGRV